MSVRVNLGFGSIRFRIVAFSLVKRIDQILCSDFLGELLKSSQLFANLGSNSFGF